MNKGAKPGRPCLRWTEARRQQFLEQLAATCNIGFSCAAVGMTRSGFYRLRMRDAQFAAQFAEALQAGYEAVEAGLLERALAGGGAASAGEAGAIVTPAFDPELAMRVLQQRHADQRKRSQLPSLRVKRATEREIEDELVRKLKGLAKRLARLA